MAYINLGQIVYPVGSVYISYTNVSPATLFGGNWAAITGRFPYFNAGTGTGGSNTHTLSVNEMPKHLHTEQGYWSMGTSVSGGSYQVRARSFISGDPKDSSMNYAGGGAAHNNMPAYQTLYAWRRTA